MWAKMCMFLYILGKHILKSYNCFLDAPGFMKWLT